MDQLTLPSEPIPLAAPDGTVYAYACPRCRQVALSGQVMCSADDKTVLRLANDSKGQANVCCRCRRCGADIGARVLAKCLTCAPIEEAEQNERAAAALARDERRDAALEVRLEACADRDAAGQLLHEMREISEECWCAGWLMGLEFSLWRMIAVDVNGARFGQGDVSADDVTTLRRLHEACGGWWHWDDDLDGEMFVPTEEWLKMYAAQQTEQA